MINKSVLKPRLLKDLHARIHTLRIYIDHRNECAPTWVQETLGRNIDAWPSCHGEAHVTGVFIFGLTLLELSIVLYRRVFSRTAAQDKKKEAKDAA